MNLNSNRRRWIALVVVCFGQLMIVLDSTIVNVALPAIGRSFQVASTSVASVSIYFLVSLAVFMSASGWLCLLYTSPSPRDRTRSRMPSSA